MVLFVVLVLVGFLAIGETPNHLALGPEIRDDYDDEARHQIAAFLVALGAVPLLFFVGYLRTVLGGCIPPAGCRRTSHWGARRHRCCRP